MCALVTFGVAGAVLMKRYPAPFLQRGNMRYCDFHQEMINAFAGCSDCVAATADKGVSDSEPPGIEGRDESRDKASPATADAPPEVTEYALRRDFNEACDEFEAFPEEYERAAFLDVLVRAAFAARKEGK